MRVLIVSHGHPDLQVGGGEIFAHNLYRQLLAQGVDVHFLACALPEYLPADESRRLIPYGDSGREWLYRIPPYNFFWSSPSDAGPLRQDFATFLRQLAPDVVHFQHYFLLGTEALAIARQVLPSTRILLTLHEFMAICPHEGQMVKKPGLQLCERASPEACHGCFPAIAPDRFAEREARLKRHFAQVDRFLCPSRFLLERYRDWGITPQKLVYLENGHDLSGVRHRVSSRRKHHNRFGFFGQFTPFKGVEVLLDAAQLLAKWHPDNFEIHIYGSFGVQLPEFRDTLNARLEKTECVIFHGPYSRAQVFDKMDEVDWVLVPSVWWENSPLTIEEAFASRRPVICSDIGGMREKVVHEKNGLYFHVGDVADLAATMSRCLESPELWHNLVGGIRDVRKLADCADEHLLLYQEKLSSELKRQPQKERNKLMKAKSTLTAYVLNDFLVLHWTVADTRPAKFSVFLSGVEIPKPYQGIGLSDSSQCLLVAILPKGFTGRGTLEIQDALGNVDCKLVLKKMPKDLDATCLSTFSPGDQSKIRKGLIEAAPKTFNINSSEQLRINAQALATATEKCNRLPDESLYLKLSLPEGIAEGRLEFSVSQIGSGSTVQCAGLIENATLHVLIPPELSSGGRGVLILKNEEERLYLVVSHDQGQQIPDSSSAFNKIIRKLRSPGENSASSAKSPVFALANAYGNSSGKESLVKKGDFYLKAKNLNFAEMYYLMAIEQSPQDFGALSGLAKIRLQMTFDLEAAEYFKLASQAALTATEKSSANAGLAAVCIQQGDADTAEVLFLRALEEDPENAQAYAGLAGLYEAQVPGPVEKIAAIYKKAVESAPGLVWIHKRLNQSIVLARASVATGKKPSPHVSPKEHNAKLLFQENRLVELFELQLAGQKDLPERHVQYLVSELAKIPPGHFDSIGAFTLYVARRLAEGMAMAESHTAAEMRTVSNFYLKALSENAISSPSEYVKALDFFLLGENVKLVLPAVEEILRNFSDDAGILLAAARLMLKSKLYGAARLFYAKSVELATSELSNSVWEEITSAHDLANEAKAEKYESVEKWLEKNVTSTPLTRKIPGTEDIEKFRKIDRWLDEFFSFASSTHLELLFDLNYYWAGRKFNNLDEVVLNYFRQGWLLGMSTHPAFDPAYLKTQLHRHGLRFGLEPPLLLFLRHETALGVSPNPLFEPSMYLESTEPLLASPWLDFMAGGWESIATPSQFFDDGFYRQSHPAGLDESNMSPLLHFFSKNPNGDCNRMFHAGFYTLKYKDLLYGRPPLSHYLTDGVFMGCIPNPFSDLRGMTPEQKIDFLKVH